MFGGCNIMLGEFPNKSLHFRKIFVRFAVKWFLKVDASSC